MRIISKGKTEDEILVLVAIPKEPLLVPLDVKDIILDDITDEQILEWIKQELK